MIIIWHRSRTTQLNPTKKIDRSRDQFELDAPFHHHHFTIIGALDRPNDRCHLAKWNCEMMKLKGNDKSPIPTPYLPVKRVKCFELMVMVGWSASGLSHLEDVPRQPFCLSSWSCGAQKLLFSSGVVCFFLFDTCLAHQPHTTVAHLLLWIVSGQIYLTGCQFTAVGCLEVLVAVRDSPAAQCTQFYFVFGFYFWFSLLVLPSLWTAFVCCII